MGQILERPFADGSYPFRMGGGEIRELQRICDAGPLEIYRRLLAGTWRYDDVLEVHRLGLLGAARKGHTATVRGEQVLVTPKLALSLVADYVETYAAPRVDPDGETGPETGNPAPWTWSSLMAAEILEAGIMGSRDEPLGKKPQGEAEEPSDRPSPTEKSDGEASSPPTPTEE